MIILRTWWSFCCRNLPALSTPGLRRKPSRASRMFTISPKSNPTPKAPQPERLDEVYAALKNGLQWVLSHQAPCIKWILISSLICAPSVHCACVCFSFNPGITCRFISRTWTASADRWKDPRGTPDWHVWLLTFPLEIFSDLMCCLLPFLLKMRNILVTSCFLPFQGFLYELDKVSHCKFLNIGIIPSLHLFVEFTQGYSVSVLTPTAS